MGGKSKTAFSLHFKVKFVNMNKVNYQKVLEQIIEKNERENRVPTLLLHSCCAPCSSYCLEYLSNYFKITVFYYNPNIYLVKETDGDKKAGKLRIFCDIIEHKSDLAVYRRNTWTF